MDSACPRLQHVSFVRNCLCCSRLGRSCFQHIDCGFDQLRSFLCHPGKASRQQPAVFIAIMPFYGGLSTPAGNVSGVSSKLKEDCGGGERAAKWHVMLTVKQAQYKFYPLHCTVDVYCWWPMETNKLHCFLLVWSMRFLNSCLDTCQVKENTLHESMLPFKLCN